MRKSGSIALSVMALAVACDPARAIDFEPRQVNIEARFAIATGAAESLGIKFDNNFLVDARLAGSYSIGNTRVQADAQVQGTTDYCGPCGGTYYGAGAVHVNWMLSPNFEAGLLGGLATTNTVFKGPTNNYAFVAIEGRYLFGTTALVGFQAGYLDLTSGPGTLANSYFVEGRATVRAMSPWDLAFGNAIATDYSFRGIAQSGKTAAGSLGTDTIGWGMTMSRQIGPNLYGYLDYSGFRNVVDTLGAVWKEHIFSIGVKMNTGPDAGAIEPVTPSPWTLRVIAKH